MTVSKLKSHLEFATNIIVVLVIIVALAIAVRQYFRPKDRQTDRIQVQTGTVFPSLQQVDYSRAPKTLILALNVGCRFCIASIPFYQRLAETQRENNGAFQTAAIFLNEQSELVNQFMKENKLIIPAVSSVDFSSLRIALTPTLILLDHDGIVMKSWVGHLSEDQERDVFGALGVQYKPPVSASATTSEKVKKTFEVFDENKPLLTIEPETTAEEAQRRLLNMFDVDANGNIYVLDVSSLFIYDPQGKLIGRTLVPPDFRAPFCVDDSGQLYSQSTSGLAVYSTSLSKIREIPLKGVLSDGSTVVKVAFERNRNQLYVQVYNGTPLSQKLFRVDLRTQQAKEIFNLRDPVPFNPTYTPGAFDFALGSRYLYVSDIREYKVFLFSLDDGSLIKTFARPFEKISIQKEDASLPIRKITIGGLNRSLSEYPPIFHLSFTNKERVLVWTSKRDVSKRQIVDVYDQQMRFLGIDLRYMHPGRNTYIFANNMVYAPDFDSGKEFRTGFLSPLEVPSRPTSLKVFAE